MVFSTVLGSVLHLLIGILITSSMRLSGQASQGGQDFYANNLPAQLGRASEVIT
jgi:hypothetical protein